MLGRRSVTTALAAGMLVSGAAGAKTIDFWIRAYNAGLAEPLVKAYNASHTDQVKLNLVPNDQFVTKLGTAIAGGNPPDVIAIDLIYVPSFAAAGQMENLTAQAKKLPFFNQLSPSHVRLATYQNQVYAVPFSAEGSVLYYNKGLFRQAGLDPNKPPRTWTEVYNAAKKITALGNGVKGFYFSGACAGCNAFTFMPLIWASGGDVLSRDGQSATLNTKAVKDALGFYRRMWTEGLVPSGAQTDNGANFINAFTSGKIGMTGSGAFAISLLKSKFKNIDFGIAYLPGQTSGWSSFAGGDSIGIPKGSKNVKEAWDFIQWTLSPQVQTEILAKNDTIPVRADLAQNKYSKTEPRFVTTSTAMAKGRTPYSVHYNELFNDANGPWLSMFQRAVFKGEIDQAVTEAQSRFTQILSTPAPGAR
ncbi:ABC transporter substrate-binding protein (plasmid) [Deinococcus aetherius]|uniref:ABC transporter substrate-binding protein n=1 Tax=Deinococcus aetherius TaxID=200252 RepID=A0ABM8AIS9_9DEIO|nr:sugar ABC transporter substrate-binding protein [Deinococcus aetherius]BDP43711.1 ABC transporter substrate-binding protein [Deinococcus aetherius]